MKRSNMLKQIERILFDNNLIGSEEHEIVAKQILDVLESEGMVPPIVKEESWKILPSGEMIYAVHAWEDE